MRTERIPRTRPPRAERRSNIIAESFTALSLVLLIASIMPGANAAAPGSVPAHRSIPAMANCNGNATCDLTSTITNVQFFLAAVAVGLFGLAMSIFGIQWMTGSIHEMPQEKRVTRKKQFYDMIIGLVLVLLSVALMEIAKGLVNTS